MEELIKKAGILIEALPYIKQLYGKTVVIKYGGNAMINDRLKDCVMQDITLLKFVGVHPIVVHGGGPDISKALDAYNIQSSFVNGLRVTDQNTMQIAQMVLCGKTNKDVVSLLCKNGGKAVGLCGIDGNLIECQKYTPIIDGTPTDIGYVGDIINIDTQLLNMLAHDQYIPVIAPIGVDADGVSYNINADTVAASVARAIKAEKLMLLTDIDGVLDSDGNIIFEMSVSDVTHKIESGIISGGMIPKVQSCVEAINAGVNRVHIIDGRVEHCILLEIFTNTGIGTMFTQ